MFKMLSDKQSATEMESEVSKKCDLIEEFSTISYTTLPICRLQPKMQNTKSTVGALSKPNNDSSHDVITFI